MTAAIPATLISALTDIAPALRANLDPAAGTTEITATFTLTDPATGTSTTQDAILPVVYGFALENGTAFEALFVDDTWRTVVTAAPAENIGGLQVGDIVATYISTSDPIGGHDPLLNIFNREAENGTERYTFAVQRDGTMWVAALNYSAEND